MYCCEETACGIPGGKLNIKQQGLVDIFSLVAHSIDGDMIIEFCGKLNPHPPIILTCIIYMQAQVCFYGLDNF